MVFNLNAGVVGTGYAGRLHLNILKGIKNVKTTCLCDVNQSTVSAVAREFGVPTYYTDFSEMLSNEALDFITICTPPSSHAPLGIKAIESGVHVLIEKPFTATTEEAMSIVNTLKRSEKNIKVGVDHSLAFSRPIQEAQKIIKRGDIGRILNLMIIRTNAFSRDSFMSNRDHWCHQIPGGRVCEALPHQVYLAQELLDDLKVKDVTARKLGSAPWVSYDEVEISLESDTALGSIYWSRNAEKQEYILYLIGSKGILRIELDSCTIVRIQRHTAPTRLSQVKYTLTESRQLLSSLMGYNGRWLLRKCGFKHAIYSPHEACIRSFVDSIINDQEPYINAQKGYDCMRLTEDICNKIQDISTD